MVTFWCVGSRRFTSQLGQTKDFTNGTCIGASLVSAQHKTFKLMKYGRFTCFYKCQRSCIKVCNFVPATSRHCHNLTTWHDIASDKSVHGTGWARSIFKPYWIQNVMACKADEEAAIVLPPCPEHNVYWGHLQIARGSQLWATVTTLAFFILE